MQALVDILHPSDERLQNGAGAAMSSQLSSSIAGAVGMPLSGPDPNAALKSPVISAAKQLRPSEGSNKISPPGIGGGTAQVGHTLLQGQDTNMNMQALKLRIQETNWFLGVRPVKLTRDQASSSLCTPDTICVDASVRNQMERAQSKHHNTSLQTSQACRIAFISVSDGH